jgi:hypothetical protein
LRIVYITMAKDISTDDNGKDVFAKRHCIDRSDTDWTTAFHASRYTRALIYIQSYYANTRHEMIEFTEEAAGSAASIKNTGVLGVGKRLP